MDNQRNFQQRQIKDRTSSAQKVFNETAFSDDWINIGADKTMVEYAKKMGISMSEFGLTTSKIRSVYGEIKRIQMGGFRNAISSFYLLQPKVAYAVGRDTNNEGLKLFKLVFDKAFDCVSTNDSKTFLNFCNFMEAILAYHKAAGGKEN